jgi:hypothetical protein
MRISTPEKYHLHEVFFQKLTQFLQVNKVIDAAHSNIHGCLSRDTYVFHFS